jgi:5'-deoxynucleotidase YfbR-like HD superfamily hydrolase
MTNTKTKKYLDDMETRIKDFVVQEDKKIYHKLSELMHKMSPETGRRIDEINRKLTSHDQREQQYWRKIDAMESSIAELKNVFEKHSESMEEHIKAIKTLSDLIASGRVIRAVASLVGWTLVIIGGFVALKNWIK